MWRTIRLTRAGSGAGAAAADDDTVATSVAAELAATRAAGSKADMAAIVRARIARVKVEAVAPGAALW